MSFYRQFYLAITDFRFYQESFQQRLRRTLRYHLFLSAHVAVFLTLLWSWVILPAAADFFQWAARNLPAWKVEGGVLKVDADMPLKRNYPADPPWTFVFDTTGAYQDATGLKEPAVLFLRERLILKYQGQLQTHLWEDLGGLEVQPQHMNFYQTYFRWLYFPLAYSWLLTWTLLAKALQALILSLVAMSTASIYGVRLTLTQAFTIAIYSLTPAIVIDLLVRCVGVEVQFFDIIYLLTAGVYVYLASQKCVTS